MQTCMYAHMNTHNKKGIEVELIFIGYLICLVSVLSNLELPIFILITFV